MWTAKNRGRYDRSKLRYPSDLTDDEWAYVEPLIPPAKRGGNRRHVDVREVMNGILPAGTGHQSLRASKSFMVVGAHPPSGTYDECLPDPKQHRLGVRRVRKVTRPRKDPLLGTKRALLRYWKPWR